MSRLPELRQRQLGYSWPPTPPRWTRPDQPIIVSDSDSERDDAPTAAAAAPVDEQPRPQPPKPDNKQPHQLQLTGLSYAATGANGKDGKADDDVEMAQQQPSQPPDQLPRQPQQRDSAFSSNQPSNGERPKAYSRAELRDALRRLSDSSPTAAAAAAGHADKDSSSGSLHSGSGSDEEGDGDEEQKAHDSEDMEDESSAAMEAAAASVSSVHDIRDVQQEDFTASQRELQEDAAATAAVAAGALQPSSPPQNDTPAQATSQPHNKRPHDAISGTAEQQVSKQLKSESMPSVHAPKHESDDELMIDETRTKVSTTTSASSPPSAASITPNTHAYFASSATTPPSASPASQLIRPVTSSVSTAVSTSRPVTNPTAPQQPQIVTQPSSTTPPLDPIPNSSPTVSPPPQPTAPAATNPPTKPPNPQPCPLPKLLSSITFTKQHSNKPPLTLNTSPKLTLFYYDPDTCPHPANGPPLAPIGRTTKKGRSLLAAYQLLQRKEELDEELATADEAMLRDEQSGKEVADRWERKIDVLQAEMDEIDEELEARELTERDRARREHDAWYNYDRLGATDEEVKRMDEENDKARAEMSDDSSADGDDDDSEESAEEAEGADEDESKEAPSPAASASPTANPFDFEHGGPPGTAHFRTALNQWQEYYHVDEDEYKRATEGVWAQGGFASGLFFENSRKEELKGARPPERKEQRKQEEVKPEVKAEVKEEKKEAPPSVESKDNQADANKENVPLPNHSPKLSPPAPPSSSPPPVAFPPVRSNKSTKPPAPTVPSLFWSASSASHAVSPPLPSSATSAQSPPTATPRTPSPTIKQQAVDKPSSVAPSSSSSSTSSAATSTSSASCTVTAPSTASFSSSATSQSRPSRVVENPLPWRAANVSRPANEVANGSAPPSRPKATSAPRVLPDGGGMIDLTDD